MSFTLGIVAIVNLAIGYALALVLEHEEPTIAPLPQPIPRSPTPAITPPASLPTSPVMSAVITQPEVDSVPVAAQPSRPAEIERIVESSAEDAAIPQPAVQLPVEPVPPANVETTIEPVAAVAVESSTLPAVDDLEPEAVEPSLRVPAVEPPAENEEAPLADKAGELVSILDDLECNLIGHYDKVSAVGESLRDQVEAPDGDSVDSCLNELKSANDVYLTQQEAASQRLLVGDRSTDSLQAMRRQLDAAFARQTGRVVTVNTQLEDVRVIADPIARCENLLDKTERLVSADQELTLTIDEVREEAKPLIAKVDDSPKPIRGQLTDAANVESALINFWQQDPNSSKRICVAQIEIDNLRQLNAEVSSEIANRIAKEIENCILEGCGPLDQVAPLGRSRFLAMLPDKDGATCAAWIDRVRQVVQTTEFAYAGQVARSTVTCAVVESEILDSVETLLARVASTLSDARTGGRNRTLYHNGTIATVVAQSKEPVETRHVEF